MCDAALTEAFRIYELPSSSAREMTIREVFDRDWLGEWKKSWQPVAVGERFIIAPPWAEIADARAQLVIRIEPGMAVRNGHPLNHAACAWRPSKSILPAAVLSTWGLEPASSQLPPQSFFLNARVEACWRRRPGGRRIAAENARLNGVCRPHCLSRGFTLDDATAVRRLWCAQT